MGTEASCAMRWATRSGPCPRDAFRGWAAGRTTRPISPLLLVGAAITAETARWLGEWADGLITVYKPKEELQEVVEAFREGGGADKPMRLQMQVSYADSDDEAERAAYEQWRPNILDSPVLAALRMPAEFDAAA
jgi:coenzyme F420-dependent glucose-6-phosphate dehydrogenase